MLIKSIDKTPQIITNGERTELINIYGIQRQMYLEKLKRLIVEQRRVDLLATKVLGYTLQPFHLNMLQFQFANRNNLQLVFRGAGKSTICTVTKAIWYMCVWPDARMVIASKTQKQAMSRLKEIKGHLAGNEVLIELFGEFYNKNMWNAREIEILQRNSNDATPTVACVGAKGSIAGAHFDIEFSDDLIDKSNSWTTVTREEVDEWYNSTFTPMLDPPDPDLPYRRDRNRVGTRYHNLDQYGTWMKRNLEAKKKGLEPPIAVNIIPALHPETGQSPWPERFPIKVFHDIKAEIGAISFGAQYLNTTDGMKGEMFKLEDCQPISWQEIEPLLENEDLFISMGVDLAISEKASADDFAIVVVGRLGTGRRAKYYVLYSYNNRLRFKKQTQKIVEVWKRWKPQRIGIETIAYQQAQYQNLYDEHPEIRKYIRRINPRKGDDKISRGHRLTTKFENKQIFFPEKEMNINGEKIFESPAWKLREQLILFPSAEHDDLYDAFEMAISMSNIRINKHSDENLKVI